jgi:hypothetical protein
MNVVVGRNTRKAVATFLLPLPSYHCHNCIGCCSSMMMQTTDIEKVERKRERSEKFERENV